MRNLPWFNHIHNLSGVSSFYDITYYRGRVYAAVQNGVGPQGQASPLGATSSPIVAFNAAGYPCAPGR